MKINKALFLAITLTFLDNLVVASPFNEGLEAISALHTRVGEKIDDYFKKIQNQKIKPYESDLLHAAAWHDFFNRLTLGNVLFQGGHFSFLFQTQLMRHFVGLKYFYESKGWEEKYEHRYKNHKRRIALNEQGKSVAILNIKGNPIEILDKKFSN